MIPHPLKQVRPSIIEMREHRFFSITTMLGLAMIALSIGLIFWQLWPDIQTKPAIPLHYNIHFGVDQFGAWTNIFTIPITGLIILAANTICAIFLWRRDHVLSYFFTSVSLLSQVMLLVAMVFVVLLNLSYA